jgi:PhnB protein
MSKTNNNCFIQPYLFFNGSCEQAVEFYRKALGAEVEMMMRFQDSPEPPPPGMVPPGFENKIMHASFRIGETTVMASDGCATEKASFQGFTLSLSVPSEAEADRAFAALADGGQVRMPLAKTFWSPRFGMVADRFGVSWMISVAPPVNPFVFSRTFDAPRDRVWKAWTERERLMQWFGPKGFTMTTAQLDFRPGGNFHYCLRSPDGKEMWGKFVYRVIDAPERIVLVNSFSDEKGGLTRHPFSATWPLEMLSKTTLVEEGGKTNLTIEWSPLNPTAEERKTFDTSHDGMKQGWSGTFDQLAAYLAKA